jgi:glycosyltransferase involved in cell wall biosynthesis
VSQLANEIANRDNGIRIVIAPIGRDSVQQFETVATELMHPARIGAFWRWSPNLITHLNDVVTRHHIDLIHIHGVWTAIQLVALLIARYRKISCIVSSHAMLEPWYWNKQSLFKKYKKKIYFNFIFQCVVTEKVIFHAITPIEKDSLQKLLPRQKIVTIPNAIGLDRKNVPVLRTFTSCKRSGFVGQCLLQGKSG